MVTALAGTMIFLLSLSGGYARALISAATIAFAIGALAHLVVRGSLITEFLQVPPLEPARRRQPVAVHVPAVADEQQP